MDLMLSMCKFRLLFAGPFEVFIEYQVLYLCSFFLPLWGLRMVRRWGGMMDGAAGEGDNSWYW